MEVLQYPRNELDQPGHLTAWLGSIWSRLYHGNTFIQELARSQAFQTAQVHQDLREALQSVSRQTIPVFHKERWKPLTIRRSELNQTTAISRYDQDRRYDRSFYYDRPVDRHFFSIPAPTGLAKIQLITGHLHDSPILLFPGLDFWYKSEVLTFRENPFEFPDVDIRPVFEGNQVIDQELRLWLFGAEFDWEYLWEQLGYVWKLRLPSSENYRRLLNVLADSLIRGTTVRDIQEAWSAIVDVPLVREEHEQVTQILQDARHLLVITDQHVYRFRLGSQPIVQVGDSVRAGDPLVDTLQFWTLNRGQVPEGLSALLVGSCLLLGNYDSEFVFENQEVPLIREYDTQGRVRVSWDIGGFPFDARQFFDLLHERGISKEKTLAQWLDRRQNPEGEPPEGSLPATINPLQFLTENVLRHHAFIVKLRIHLCGPSQLGLATVTRLREMIPPQTLMLIVIEVAQEDPAIIPNQPGTETHPGTQEAFKGFPCSVTADVLDTGMITENIRLWQIRGKCT